MTPVAHEFFGGCMIATLLVGMIALAPAQMEPGAVAISAISARGPHAAHDARALAPAAVREAEIIDARLDLVVMSVPESALD